MNPARVELQTPVAGVAEYNALIDVNKSISATHVAGVMALEADDFDKPVRDYVFTGSSSARELIDAMSQAGGFSATKLATARDLLSDQFAALDAAGHDAEKCLNWLSFPACLCATGARGFFVEALRQRRFNVVVSTCGTLDHDIARCHSDYYHGSFELDDHELADAGLNRLGSVIVPNSSYGESIEAVVMPALEDIRSERIESTGLSGTELWKGFGTVELCWELGRRVCDENSILHWAAEHEIPIVIPGPTDGSIGAQLFMFRQRHADFWIDILADEQRLSDLTWLARSSNALIVGGGISKHHVIWWNQYRDGLDSAVYITTAPEHDGSLSGARPREAISWGKLRAQAPHVCVEGDASVLLPLLGADLLSD